MPGSIKALRLHNLLLGNGLTGAQLEAELASASKAGAFEASLRQRTIAANLKASTSALSAVGASPIALNAVLRQDMTVFDALLANSAAATVMAGTAAVISAVIANATALGKLTASATAMAAVAASSTAMNLMVASSAAKMAIYNADTALAAIAASATAMTACRAAAQYSIKNAVENGTSSVALAWTGTAYIVVGYSRSAPAARIATLSTRRAGSAVDATMTSSGVSNTNAQDVNCAIPVTSAYSFVLNNTGTVTSYFGALRCDI